MASQIHEDDIGPKFLVTVTDDGSAVDISSATSLVIYIKKLKQKPLRQTLIRAIRQPNYKQVKTLI